MTDKPKDKTSKQNLSDEIVQQVRTHIVHGDVGYGRPPKEHQFKKGQQANPNGRPRKAAPGLTLADQPFLEAVLKSADKMITIKENGVARQMPSREAVVESVKVGAVGDRNARSQGLWADWTRQADEAKVREIRENNDLLATYQHLARQQLAEARHRGEPEPELLPHPDDIIADKDGRLRNIGPFDAISKAATDRNVMLREAFILQGGLDERLMSKPADGDLGKGPGSAFQFAKFINRSLPPRLRIDEFSMFRRIEYYSRHPLRWLLKTVSKTWRKAGIPRKRGELSPPLRAGLAAVNLLERLSQGILDGTFYDNSQYDHVMELIFEDGEFARR